MRVSKDGVHGYGELLPAALTIPHTLADTLLGAIPRHKSGGLIDYSAMWTFGAVRPALLFDMLAGCIFVPILRSK